MRVLLDTNVILDAILSRGVFTHRAWALVRKHEERTFQGFVSASAITDIYYIVEKERKHEFALQAIKKVIRMLTVIPVDLAIIQSALASSMPDFEDAVQAVAAKHFGIGIIVTRDKAGFSNSDLQVYSPEEFLEMVE